MKNQTRILIILATILGVVCITVGIISLFPRDNSNQHIIPDEIIEEEDVFDFLMIGTYND